jgi:import inner membrane translocase subunit TIM21
MCISSNISIQIAEYIQGSLSFHNNPPSAVRPRHRNRHVSYHITKDSQGREHMFLHFYVHGSDSAGAYSDSANERGYFGALAQWTRDKASSVSDLNLEDSLAWSKAYALHVWDRWKRAFRYLSGAPISQLPSQPPLETPEQIPKEKDSWWGAAGLFGSLRRNRERIVERKEGIGRVFMDGEVHAELIQVRTIFRRISSHLLWIRTTKDTLSSNICSWISPVCRISRTRPAQLNS